MQHGVTLKKVSASYISALNTVGVLSFCKHQRNEVHFFEWQQSAMCEITDTESQDSGWSLVDTIESTSSAPISAVDDESKPSNSKSAPGNDKPRKDTKISFRVPFRDLKGLEIVKNELRFYGQEYSIHSVYLFNHGSPQSFVDFLERKRFIKKSSRRKPFYHCLEQTDNDKLQKSFSELNIEDIRNQRSPSLYIDLMSKLANVHHQILPLNRQPEEYRPRMSPQRETEDVANHNSIVVLNGKEEKSKLVPKPPVHRGPPLDASKWAEFKSPNGTILNVESVKEIIFKGVCSVFLKWG